MEALFLSQKDIITLRQSLFDFVVHVADLPSASPHRIAILPQMTELLFKFIDPDTLRNS